MEEAKQGGRVNNMTEVVKRRLQTLCAVAVGATILSASADVVVRNDNDTGDGSVKVGETQSRDIYACAPAPYYATTPFAVSFAPKFEAPGESWDVVMFRLNILVGSHRAVYALDIGGLGNFADYKMDGIGVAGLFNSVGESDGAFHVAGIINFAAFDFSGCQISGVYSCTEGSHCGLQIGCGNYTGKLTGLQIGVFNYAERLNGVQIGLVNVNRSSPVTFLPIANAAF